MFKLFEGITVVYLDKDHSSPQVVGIMVEIPGRVMNHIFCLYVNDLLIRFQYSWKVKKVLEDKEKVTKPVLIDLCKT